MPIIYNGLEVKKVIYNNVELDKVIYKNTEVFSAFIIPADGEDEYLYYVYDSSIKGYKINVLPAKIDSLPADFTIPSSYNNVPVTGISEYAFYHSSTFEGSATLTNITIPDSIVYIGIYAFRNCLKLSSLNIPDSVKTIDDYAFKGCTGLTEVTIGSGIETIDYEAFRNCTSLKKITCKAIVPPTIQDDTFKKLPTDCIIYVPAESVEAYKAAQYWSALNIQPILESTPDEYFTFTLLSDNTYSLKAKDVNNMPANVVLPSKYQELPVASISEWAFRDCTGLTNIVIPDSVTEIGAGAFFNCKSLINVTLSNNINSINNAVFFDCTGLTSITIPNSVKTIGGNSFSGCSSLESITIPFVGAKAGVTSSDKYQYPFGYIFGTDKYIGGVATEQSYYASSTSSTTKIIFYIPESLKNVTITGGNILYGAFSNCTGLTNIKIPDSVTFIRDYAFLNCTGLTSITIPNSVTKIGSGVFRDCTGLTSIIIPNSVTFIGSGAFYNCTNLTSFTSKAITPPTIYSLTLRNVPADCAIYVPAESVDAYKAASYWSTRAAYIQAIPS